VIVTLAISEALYAVYQRRDPAFPSRAMEEALKTSVDGVDDATIAAFALLVGKALACDRTGAEGAMRVLLAAAAHVVRGTELADLIRRGQDIPGKASL
jgi:hypothetical protein